MKRKNNIDKRNKQKAKRKQRNNFNEMSQENNVSIYNNNSNNVNFNAKKAENSSSLFKKQRRKKVIKLAAFKNYIIVLIIALVILLISILSGNKEEDVSKYFYLNNNKIVTEVPIRVTLAKNSTAKVAILALEDIQKNFDENIRYNNELKKIITIGKTHVAKIFLNDYSININGTDSVINVSAFEDSGKIYLPLNDLSSVYGIEVFVTNANKVIVDEIHKEKKIVKVFDNTKLKKSKSFLSKTLTKLDEYEDYVLVEEYRNKFKIRTIEGLYGYISAKKLKSMIEIRSDYIDDNKKDYNYIRNYRHPGDNFDEVIKQGEDNVSIIDIFNVSPKAKNIILTEKYSKEEVYKAFIEKLKSNNIELVAELNLEDYQLDTYLETFDKRAKFISELLKVANKHNVQGVELLVSETSKLEIYENFIEELKSRLKERGLKLFIPQDKIKNDKIRGIVDYGSTK